MMDAVVGPQSVSRAVEGEGRVSDAVGAASDDCAEVGRIVKKPGDFAVAKHDVAHAPIAIAGLDRQNDPAERHRAHFRPARIAQRDQIDVLAPRRSAEGPARRAHQTIDHASHSVVPATPVVVSCGASPPMDLDIALDLKAELGEGPIWDPERQRLLFVDIMRGAVHVFDPSSGEDTIYDVGQPVSAITPTVRQDWLLAVRDGFMRLDPDTGATTLVAGVEIDNTDNRMNDGYCDARGRFWAGTLSMRRQ